MPSVRFLSMKQVTLTAVLWVFLAGFAPASALQVLETPDATVFYDSPSFPVAREIPGMYRDVHDELRRFLGFSLSYRPAIRLVEGGAGEETRKGVIRFLAYAQPEEGLIVLRLTPMKASSVPLPAVLKHEVCHLVLHDAVPGGHLPRWLDEGVAQWVSGGISEVVVQRRPFFLPGAILMGGDVPLNRLEPAFHGRERDVLFAYEKSRSFVEFLLEKRGAETLQHLLNGLSAGQSVDEAILSVYGTSLEDLEKSWRYSLMGVTGWLFYLSRYLYEILFFIGAIVAFLGFLRYRKRKKDYGKDEDEPEEEFLFPER